MINFQNLQILQKFKEYLAEKNETIAGEEEKYDTDSANIYSQYSGEFRNFIQETFGSKYDSIFTEGFQASGLQDIKYVNGSFQNTNDQINSSEIELFTEILNELTQTEGFMDTIDTNFDGQVSDEEYNGLLTNLSDTEGKINSDKFLSFVSNSIATAQKTNEFFSDQKNIEMFDVDKDGVLSDAEKINSKCFLSSLTGDNNGLGEDDFELFTQMFDGDGDGVLSNAESKTLKKCIEILGKDEANKDNPLGVLKNYINTLYQNPAYTKDNLIEFIKGLDGNGEDLTAEDVLKLSEYAAMGIMPNEILEADDELSAQTSPAGSGANAPFNPAIKEMTVDNMSIEELEAELQNAKEATKTALADFEATLEQENAELAKKLEEVNKNITDTQNEITETQTTITEKEASLSDAKTQVSSLDGQISSLEGQLSTCEDESEKSSIRAKIAELKGQKEQLENETIPQLNEQIAQAKEKLEELNAKLEEYNTQLTEVQNEISALAQTNPTIAAKQEAYNQALQYESTVQQKLELRKADAARAENVDMPSLDERSEDYSGNEEYDFTNMPLTYNLNGKEFHCVGSTSYTVNGKEYKIDSIEQLQRLFANGGLANIGQYGTMQCHNYSNVFADFMLGSIDSRIVEAIFEENYNPAYGDQDTAGLMGSQGEYNKRDFAQCKAKNRDEERAIIENELQNGRPVLVSVPGKSGTHWVTAIGISDDGDILIWDSYDGGVEVLGKSSNTDTNSLGRNMATANGIMVYCKGYSFQYATAKHIDYWEYIRNPNYDPLVEGIK